MILFNNLNNALFRSRVYYTMPSTKKIMKKPKKS